MKPAIRIVFAPLFKRPKSFQKGEKHEKLFLHGEATVPGRTVKIDPRGSALLETLVHEVAHINNPSWTEKMVQDYTKIRLKKMGWKEKANWLKMFGNAIIEGEE
jgi:hypothetical protein